MKGVVLFVGTQGSKVTCHHSIIHCARIQPMIVHHWFLHEKNVQYHLHVHVAVMKYASNDESAFDLFYIVSLAICCFPIRCDDSRCQGHHHTMWYCALQVDYKVWAFVPISETQRVGLWSRECVWMMVAHGNC